MKKKLKLEELRLKSFVTDASRLDGGLAAIAIDPIGRLTEGENCHSPLCMSNPECSFKPCEA